MKPIAAVSQLVEYVRGHCGAGLHLFRGQRCDKELKPKIGRDPFLADDFLEREQRLIQEFKIRSNPYLNSSDRDSWDWLAIAQHNGMATRLLDWTDNPLAALWFVVRKDPDKGRNGALWVFHVPEQDIVADQRKADPFKSSRTKVYRPKHLTETIVAQGGWFTVHKYMDQEKRFIPFEKIAAYKPHREKLIVPGDQFHELRSELDRLGINDASMFPGLRGLCEHLNWTHRAQLSVPRFPRTDAY